MLRGDWQRASRAWGLLMRTEIAGRGIDVRQHGRWGIGAEILIQRERNGPVPRAVFHHGDDDAQSVRSDAAPSPAQAEPAWCDEGFKLAREYYERLILQYPHTPRTRDALNATTFYPALFSTWVYGVQARYKSLRKQALERRPSTSDSNVSDDTNEHNNHKSQTDVKPITRAELEDAIPIVQRMDELLLSPPYDTSLPLLHLRGMVGLWLADLYLTQTPDRKSRASDESITSSPEARLSNHADRLAAARSRENSNDERAKAQRFLEKVEALSESVMVHQALASGIKDDMLE